MDTTNQARKECPLFIASSGGGGHIAAITGIIDYHRREPGVHLVKYYSKKQHNRSAKLLRTFLYSTIFLKSFQFMAHAWKWFHDDATTNNFLHDNLFWQEIGYLKDPVRTQQARYFVDLLLDVYSFGYEMAAIYNSLQRQDKSDELLYTIHKQALNDAAHYALVKSRLITLLKKQALSGTPYSSIISTQPQSLAAMCDAVAWYNAVYRLELAEKGADLNHHAVPLHIKEYMTDLPTKGATHFIAALRRLTKKQRLQMVVYCVGEPDDALLAIDGLQIMALAPDENPMLRPGFRDKATLLNLVTKHEIKLTYEDEGNKTSRTIELDEQVASIMLGSLGGNASADYIQPLLEKGCAHIFIFGAKNNHGVKNIIEKLTPENQKKIIALGYQEDCTIAQIATRSNYMITRSGGLCTMELMAIPIIPNKTILIHHKNPPAGSHTHTPLTSGLPWEDGNAAAMIAHFQAYGAFAAKTSPSQVRAILAALPTTTAGSFPGTSGALEQASTELKLSASWEISAPKNVAYPDKRTGLNIVTRCYVANSCADVYSKSTV